MMPAPRPDAPVFLTVKADHGLALGETNVTEDSLPDALAATTQGNRDARILLRADKTVDYGTLMGVMDQLRAAGYLKVAVVNLQKTGEGSMAP
ncbi:Biopolymer transporter ExbD [Komagataeibacter xylinus]